MAILMSNFEDFDIDQILLKLAQRYVVLCLCYPLQKRKNKTFFILGSLDNSENTD